MDSKKIVMVASECQPFFASGGLGDVVGSLPENILKVINDKKDKELSNEMIVILPLYSKISADYRNKLVYVKQIVVQLSWRKQYCGIFKYTQKGVTYYFLDNEYYFKRHNFYGYFDDGERFAFFSKAAVDTLVAMDITPDVIHVHDWQTALVPVYLRTLYYGDLRFAHTKTIFTIHNIEYQGQYALDQDIVEDVFGISHNDAYLLEYKGVLNLMKGGMEAANVVSTVSPTYAKEIQDDYYSHGLTDEIKRVVGEGKLRGILNGIDKNYYNPLKDDALFEKYDHKHPELKAENKVRLQEMLNLQVDPEVPMIGMVSRLVSHKGLDIVKDAFEEIMAKKCQVVILGTGDGWYEGFFKDMEHKYGSKLRVILAYNQDLSRKIYASSDLFLMPSKSEPCGLSQMIASRYGSVPIVRRTGGLADSINDFTVNGNGYTFNNSDAGEMLTVINRALDDYQDKPAWQKKVVKVMTTDFSWNKSAKEYVKLYTEIM